MENLIIRSPRMTDAEDINEMRRQTGVRETTLGLATDTLARTQGVLSNLTADDHILVAELDIDGRKKVVGMIGLQIHKNPRMRHSATLGMSVNANYQGMGIGKVLMKEILDVADNYLMLIRVELGVLESNTRARKLYESFGFVYEGTKKYAIIQNGRYAHELMMARYRIPEQFREHRE